MHATHAGHLDGALLAVLALVPLAAFELVAPLPAATQALQRSRTAAGRVFAATDASAPVVEPDTPLPLPGETHGPHTLSPALGVGRATPGPTGRCCAAWISTSRRDAGWRWSGRAGPASRHWPTSWCASCPSTRGEATLDGVALDRLASDDVRRVVGLVEQSPHLFATSLAENLRVGRRTASDEELTEVLERVGLGEWLAGLPAGLATHVGTAGTRLSGGQRQRVAVARALLAEFSILILDEPAEHLDPAAADALTADLLALTEGHSTLFITHRLAGLDEVDEIVVLDGGRVVERGTHTDLVTRRWPLRRAVVGRADERPDRTRTPTPIHPPLRIESPLCPTISTTQSSTKGATPREPLDLARWQFASTSIYHFLFVPVTIGLAFLVALLQTAWYRNGDDTYRRLARFFGSLLLINVAVGVVTGLIQEFEFGMNWSAYSRLVGNVFGGPLAMEGLAAFFLESTFLGIWIFGWNRLSKKAHLACIWLVAAGTMLSAAFIMAANSWMQHPVGVSTNNSTHQPQLNNIWALFTNPVFLWGYTHVVVASLVTGAVVMLGVSAWHLYKKNQVEAFRRTAVISLVVLLPTVAFNLFVGSELGVVEGKYQPMKIAAAEALWTTCPSHCSFSFAQIGGGQERRDPDPDHRDPRPSVHPGHQPRRRRGAGTQQPERAVPEGVRAGGLRPERLHSVLVDARHGLPGHAASSSLRSGEPGCSTARSSNTPDGSCEPRPGW